MWALTGFIVGIPLGFVLHRSDFCMHSAFREVLATKPGPSTRAYLLALGNARHGGWRALGASVLGRRAE